MTATVKNIAIEQGATFVWPFRWKYNTDSGGAPINLTGFQVRMQIRKVQGDAPQISLTQTATTKGSKITLGLNPDAPLVTPDPANGWIWVEITDDDTDLLTSKAAKYDLEAEDTDGRVYRLWKGDVAVDPNITQTIPDDVILDP